MCICMCIWRGYYNSPSHHNQVREAQLFNFFKDKAKYIFPNEYYEKKNSATKMCEK